jgi:ribonuclease P protein component
VKEKQRSRFRKAVRIKRSRELYRVLKDGHRNRYSRISVYWKENDEQRTRCAVIVSKKTGQAVDRNRYKRFVREWFRTFTEPLHNLDILIKVHAGCSEISKKTFDETMLKWYQTEKR